MRCKSIFFSLLLLPVLFLSACKHFRKNTGCQMRLVLTIEQNGEVVSVGKKAKITEILRKRLLEFGFEKDQIVFNDEGKNLQLILTNVDMKNEKKLMSASEFHLRTNEEYCSMIKFLISSNGSVRFWETIESGESLVKLIALDSDLGLRDSLLASKTNIRPDSANADHSLQAQLKKRRHNIALSESQLKHPLLSILQLNIKQTEDGKLEAVAGPVAGFSLPADTAAVNRYLNSDLAHHKLPANFVFKWSSSYSKGTPVLALYVLNYSRKENDGPAMVCSSFKGVRKEYAQDKQDEPKIDIAMSPSDAFVWKRLTNMANGQCIAMEINDRVISAPRITGEVQNGRSSVTGAFDEPDVNAMVALMNNPVQKEKIQVVSLTTKGCQE